MTHKRQKKREHNELKACQISPPGKNEAICRFENGIYCSGREAEKESARSFTKITAHVDTSLRLNKMGKNKSLHVLCCKQEMPDTIRL